MTLTFKEFLEEQEIFEDLSNVDPSDILNMFMDLKIFLNKIVQEATSAPDKVVTTLKLVAVFETFYSYFKNHHKLELGQVPGFGAFLKDYSHETVPTSKFDQFVKKISDWIQRREDDRFDIKRISESRFKQFKQWVEQKDTDGCHIIRDEIDKIIKSLKHNIEQDENLFKGVA